MTSSLEPRESEIDALARQTGFTPDAVASMTRSIRAGRGGMAQFDHSEFGGPGQWMSGGMLMIADFSDRALQQRIARLCDAIVQHVGLDAPSIEESHRTPSESAGGPRPAHDSRSWWPTSLGTPETSGAQNDMCYAWFAGARRLAIEERGTVTLYDTGDHRISGVSQQQGNHRTLAFTSQRGEVDLAALRVVGGTREEPSPAPTPHGTDDAHAHHTRQGAPSDPFAALEKLAALHAKRILSDDEFAKKKAELLARL